MKLNQTQIQSMIKSYIQHLLDEDLDYRINRNPIEPWYCDQTGIEMSHEPELMILDELKGNAVEQIARSDYSEVRKQAGEMFKMSAASLGLQEISDRELNLLCHHLLRTLPDYYDALKQRALGRFDDDQDRGETRKDQPSVPLPPDNDVQTIDTTEESLTLQELVTQYTKHQLRTGAWRKNSARNAEPQLNALLSYFKPETPIRTLTVHQMRSYVDLLQALPPRYNLLKSYKGVPLHKIDPEQLVKDHDKHLDQTTIRGYMIMARQLLKYAEGLDLIDKNPCPEILIPKKKQIHAREQRNAYTIDQLHQVFNPDTLMQWVNYGGKFNPARFWIPVLCLCSTGRLEEVCGLRAADVRSTPEGVNLRITFHDERKIKNQNSIRTVPMISVTSDRLLQYAGSLPEGSRLFPQLTVANNKLSHNFGKQWQRYVREKVGIKDTKIAPMHSLRHFLIDRLYKAMVPERVIKELDGHAPGGGETGGRYAKGLEVETLREHCLPVIEDTLHGILWPLMELL